MLRARVDRHRCIGAGTCITIAPTAFDWYLGDFAKASVVDATSVEDEVLREAALACPTAAIVVEEVEELLPWQLRGKRAAAPRREDVHVHGHRALDQPRRGARRRGVAGVAPVARRDAAVAVRRARGDEVVATGDGFFVGFDSPEEALACAVAIQRRLEDHRKQNGFAPKVRIGVHASGATQVGNNFSGKGVHEASRIAGLAEGSEIVASKETAAGSRFPVSESRTVTLRGTSEPVDIVAVEWR